METVWPKEEAVGNTDNCGNRKKFPQSTEARVKIGATRGNYQDKHNNREKQRESELKGDKRAQEYENAQYEGYLGDEDRAIKGVKKLSQSEITNPAKAATSKAAVLPAGPVTAPIAVTRPQRLQ